jgi:hypothetical protein
MNALKKYCETLDDKNYYELIFGRELASYFIRRISAYTSKAIAKEVLRYVPIVWQLLSFTTSFGIAYMVLNDILDDLHVASLKLLYFIELYEHST